jgi:hypothetical protein
MRVAWIGEPAGMQAVGRRHDHQAEPRMALAEPGHCLDRLGRHRAAHDHRRVGAFARRPQPIGSAMAASASRRRSSWRTGRVDRRR